MTENPTIIPLWEGSPPNSKPSDLKEERIYRDEILVATKVQDPSIEVRLPAQRCATGQAVIICPGGGYEILAYDWEGWDVASWLNAHGIAAFVLKYRLPETESNVVPHKSPLMDLQRAIRLVRSKADEFGIDPGKVGIMGFSAGGHMASTGCTHFDDGDADSADPVDRISSRPDFAILAYPVISMDDAFIHGGSKKNLLGESPSSDLCQLYSSHLHVSPETPPVFLFHSSDDPAVPVQNSLVFYQALLANNVPAEMHLYPYGGHGYSLAVGQGRLNSWTDRCIDWLADL